MWHFLAVFLIVGSSTLFSEVLCEETGVALAYYPDILPPEDIEPETTTVSGLSPEAITEIKILAKNISHSKSAYREGNSETGDERDVRRSILRKAEIDSETHAIKGLLEVFPQLGVEFKLEVLGFIENLVHQYDVAIKFVDMGGFKIIAPLLFSSNDTIVCSVAAVLGAAMQSNPYVQKLARAQDIGKKLLELLSHNSTIVVHRAIFAISTFLRNSPEAQEEFIAVSGISKLANILENDSIATKTKLKIVTLFNDLAAEQQDATEYYQEYRRAALQRSFADEIIKFNICGLIVSFLDANDYDTLQKTVAAMISLDIFCHQEFTSVKDRVTKLLILYDPLSDNKDAQLDKDLKSDFHRELKDLIKTIGDADQPKDLIKDEL